MPSRTRTGYLELYSGLECVIRRFVKMHERIRELDEPCDFETSEDTFGEMLKERLGSQMAAGQVHV